MQKRPKTIKSHFSYQTAHFQVPLFQEQQDNSIMEVFIWF